MNVDSPIPDFWADRDVRRLSLERMYNAWSEQHPSAAALVSEIDGCITAALSAVALPRGPVSEIRIRLVLPSMNGRKLAR